MERIPIEELRQRVLRKFERSGARHLILTGSIGIGKSTLLRRIQNDLKSYSGIRTWLDFDPIHSTRSIKLQEIGGDEIYTAASWDGQKMVEEDHFFETKGVELLEKHQKLGATIFLFDEIGRVEKKSPEFLARLRTLLDTKIFYGVKKKEESAFDELSIGREDFFLLDLDDFYGEIPSEELKESRRNGRFAK